MKEFELPKLRKAPQLGSALNTSSALGGTTAASTVATTTTTSAATASSVAATTASSLSIVGGIIGAVNLAMAWGKSTPHAGAASGAAVGAAVGTLFFPGPGTAIGAAVGMIGGALIGSIRAGKHRDQQARDAARAALQDAHILDDNFQLPLPDGTTYNMGLDGGRRGELGGRRPFEIDTQNPLTAYAVSWLNPAIELLLPGNQKLKTDFVGYFANAALSNARSLEDVRINVNSFIQRLGISDEQLAQAVIQRAHMGQIPPNVAHVYLNGIQERTNPQFQLPVQIETPMNARTTEREKEDEEL